MTTAERNALLEEFAARLAAERQLILDAVAQKAALEWEPMTREQTCVYLGIARGTLVRKVHRGELPKGFGGGPIGTWWTRRGIIEWGGLRRKHQKRR